MIYRVGSRLYEPEDVKVWVVFLFVVSCLMISVTTQVPMIINYEALCYPDMNITIPECERIEWNTTEEYIWHK